LIAGIGLRGREVRRDMTCGCLQARFLTPVVSRRQDGLLQHRPRRPAIALDCMTHGKLGRAHPGWSLSEAESSPLIRQAVEAGTNFFDTLWQRQVRSLLLTLIACAGNEPPLASLKPGASTAGFYGADQSFRNDPLHGGSNQRSAQRRADTSPDGCDRTQSAVPPATDSTADDGNGDYAVHSDHQ
jgi:hypothetical protein